MYQQLVEIIIHTYKRINVNYDILVLVFHVVSVTIY